MIHRIGWGCWGMLQANSEPTVISVVSCYLANCSSFWIFLAGKLFENSHGWSLGLINPRISLGVSIKTIKQLAEKWMPHRIIHNPHIPCWHINFSKWSKQLKVWPKGRTSADAAAVLLSVVEVVAVVKGPLPMFALLRSPCETQELHIQCEPPPVQPSSAVEHFRCIPHFLRIATKGTWLGKQPVGMQRGFLLQHGATKSCREHGKKRCQRGKREPSMCGLAAMEPEIIKVTVDQSISIN